MMNRTHRIACSSVVLAWALALPASAGNMDKGYENSKGSADSSQELRQHGGYTDLEKAGTTRLGSDSTKDHSSGGKESMTSSSGQGFGELDQDANGMLSRDEAQDHKQLRSKWNWVDQNGDSQIDKSEFSAFEELGIREDPKGEHSDSQSEMEGSKHKY